MISKDFPHKHRRKHRKNVLLEHVEVRERVKTGVAVNNALAIARL